MTGKGGFRPHPAPIQGASKRIHPGFTATCLGDGKVWVAISCDCVILPAMFGVKLLLQGVASGLEEFA